MAKKYKAVRESVIDWQLEGESTLQAATLPAKIKPDALTTIRLTHSNVYGPVEDVDFFVRLGDPKKPSKPADLKSSAGWVKAVLVEELVMVDDEEVLRADADEPFEEETPWDGTFDATLKIPAGKHGIEIKIVSRTELVTSRILSDWQIKV